MNHNEIESLILFEEGDVLAAVRKGNLSDRNVEVVLAGCILVDSKWRKLILASAHMYQTLTHQRKMLDRIINSDAVPDAAKKPFVLMQDACMLAQRVATDDIDQIYSEIIAEEKVKNERK